MWPAVVNESHRRRWRRSRRWLSFGARACHGRGTASRMAIGITVGGVRMPGVFLPVSYLNLQRWYLGWEHKIWESRLCGYWFLCGLLPGSKEILCPRQKLWKSWKCPNSVGSDNVSQLVSAWHLSTRFWQPKTPSRKLTSEHSYR